MSVPERRSLVGGLALALIGVTALFAAWQALPLLGLLALDDGSGAISRDDEARLERFEGNQGKFVARFEGRSIFFDPPPPRREPPSIVRDEPEEDRPPPPPSRYGGPRIVAMFGETVWFSDGRRLRIGDDADNGLRVLGLDCPWDATVEWKGVEFTVEFFDRDTVLGAISEQSEGADDVSEPDGSGDDTEEALVAADPTNADEQLNDSEAQEERQ